MAFFLPGDLLTDSQLGELLATGPSIEEDYQLRKKFCFENLFQYRNAFDGEGHLPGRDGKSRVHELFYATLKQSVLVVERLVQEGEDVNAWSVLKRKKRDGVHNDRGNQADPPVLEYTALHAAVGAPLSDTSIAIVKDLLRGGAKFISEESDMEKKPHIPVLLLALYTGKVKLVDLFLERLASMKPRDTRIPDQRCMLTGEEIFPYLKEIGGVVVEPGRWSRSVEKAIDEAIDAFNHRHGLPVTSRARRYWESFKWACGVI